MNADEARREARSRIGEYLAAEYGYDVRRPFRCLNPKHEDKHPSMSLDTRTGRVKCFSCGASYDIFDIFEVSRCISKAEAFREVYRYFGLALDPAQGAAAAPSARTADQQAEAPAAAETIETEAARRRAAALFRKSPAAAVDHAYLRRKGLTRLYGDIRQAGDALLLAYTAINGGKLIYTETITPQGEKRKAAGTRPSAGPAAAYQIQGKAGPFSPSSRIIITEGAADAETLAAALTLTPQNLSLFFIIAAAGGSQSLTSCAKAFHEVHPQKKIFIAADNDEAGIFAAKSAYKAGNCSGVLLPLKEKDWNDFYNARRQEIDDDIALFVVQREIERQIRYCTRRTEA